MDSASDGDRPLSDGRYVGIRGIGKQNGGVGPLHDDPQIVIILPDHNVMVSRRDFQIHGDWKVNINGGGAGQD